jgi:hypothetical protein
VIKLYAFGAAWIASGILGAGISQADYAKFNRGLHPSNHDCREFAREDQQLSLGFAIAGPIDLAAVLTTVDYPIRGWTLSRQTCEWTQQ